jgi:hypothetical protein
MDVCSGIEKLDELINLTMSFDNPEMIVELTEKGCLIPNCLTRSWDRKFERQLVLEGNQSKVEYVIAAKTKVLFTVTTLFTE